MTLADAIKTRIGKCHAGCGADVEIRTKPYVLCEPCRAKLHLERARRTSDRKRRDDGVARVKGTTIKCERCAEPFERIVIRTKFCRPCAKIHYLETARERSRAKVAANQAARLRGG